MLASHPSATEVDPLRLLLQSNTSRIRIHLSSADAAPVLSPLARELLNDPGALDRPRVARAIEADASLMASAVALANSALYGIPGEHFYSLKSCIQRVGVDALRDHLAAASVCRSYPSLSEHAEYIELWQIQLTVAFGFRRCVARFGARLGCEMSSDSAYFAGLLSGIGLFSVACTNSAFAATIAAAAKESYQGVLEALDTAGFAVESVSADMAELLGAPRDVVRLIRESSHLRPAEGELVCSGLLGLARVGALLCFPSSCSPADGLAAPTQALSARFNLDHEEVESLFQEIAAGKRWTSMALGRCGSG